MKKLTKKQLALRVLGALIGVVVLAIIALNIYIRVAYSAFHNNAQEEFSTPGIHEGLVPQGLDYASQSEAWFITGYDANGGNSPVYRGSKTEGFTKFYLAYPDGTPCKGHNGGITSDENHVFVTDDNRLLVYSLNDCLNATEGDTVVALGEIPLEFEAAFVQSTHDALYVGEFYDGNQYVTPESHAITTPDGTENHALMIAFKKDSAEPYGYRPVPCVAYSLPNQVQGMCTDEAGNIYLATSWAINTSKLISYDASKLTLDGGFVTDNGTIIDLYCLDSRNLAQTREMPPMAEGIEYVEGRIVISNEAASNKYIFGKLYGADMMYSLAATN